MGVTNSNKVINTDRILCDGALRVTLALTAAPDIVSNPTDIVLVLDRSGSMTGTPLANLKLGSNTLLTSLTRPPTAPRTVRSAQAAEWGSSAFPVRCGQYPADHLCGRPESRGRRSVRRRQHQPRRRLPRPIQLFDGSSTQTSPDTT